MCCFRPLSRDGRIVAVDIVPCYRCRIVYWKLYGFMIVIFYRVVVVEILLITLDRLIIVYLSFDLDYWHRYNRITRAHTHVRDLFSYWRILRRCTFSTEWSHIVAVLSCLALDWWIRCFLEQETTSLDIASTLVTGYLRALKMQSRFWSTADLWELKYLY